MQRSIYRSRYFSFMLYIEWKVLLLTVLLYGAGDSGGYKKIEITIFLIYSSKLLVIYKKI